MEKLFFSHQSRLFNFDLQIYKVLFHICTLFWRVELCFPPGKGLNRGIESADSEPCRTSYFLLALCKTDDINKVFYFLLLEDCEQQFDFCSSITISCLSLTNTSTVEITTLRNKRKLGALNKESCEEDPMSNLAQNSIVPRSREIGGRVTKKLSQEFSRTKNRILGALSRVDNFLMNPLVQSHFGTALKTSRKEFRTNQGTNEDFPSLILVLNQGSPITRRHETLAQRKATTW